MRTRIVLSHARPSFLLSGVIFVVVDARFDARQEVSGFVARVLLAYKQVLAGSSCPFRQRTIFASFSWGDAKLGQMRLTQPTVCILDLFD